MKLEISKKMLTFAVVGLIAIIVLALVINRYRSRSKFEWPVPGAEVMQDDTKLKNDLQGYQDTFNLAIIGVNAMPTGTQAERDAKNSRLMAAETTLSTSINRIVGQYVTAKCPAVATGAAPAATGVAATDAANTAAWNAYQTDLAKVQQAYYSVVGSATPTTTPPSDQVLAARKADISGATRKYIASICPKFYKTAGADPTPTYKTWVNVDSGSAPAVGLLKTAVTTGSITTWAGYVAKTKSTTSTVTVLPGATDVGPVAIPDTNGFAVGDKIQFTYQVVNKDTGVTTTAAPVMGTIKSIGASPISITITPDIAVPDTGYIIPPGTVIAKAMVSGSLTWNKLDAAGVPNWKKARDYGPGSYPQPSWGTV